MVKPVRALQSGILPQRDAGLADHLRAQVFSWHLQRSLQETQLLREPLVFNGSGEYERTHFLQLEGKKSLVKSQGVMYDCVCLYVCVCSPLKGIGLARLSKAYGSLSRASSLNCVSVSLWTNTPLVNIWHDILGQWLYMTTLKTDDFRVQNYSAVEPQT